MKEKELVNKLIKCNKTISTMESCTSGYLATTITNVEGASSVLKFSVITYSNEYKIKMGVDPKIIDKYTVYSIETATSMAHAIYEYTKSDYAVGITGQINRMDPNNMFGNVNEIFCSIYNSKDNVYTNFSISCPNNTRKDCKEYIVDKILDKLLEIV